MAREHEWQVWCSRRRAASLSPVFCRAREVPRPTVASARRSEYDSAAAVVGSGWMLTLNGEMVGSSALCGALQRLY